jgi:hypothetical protein
VPTPFAADAVPEPASVVTVALDSTILRIRLLLVVGHVRIATRVTRNASRIVEGRGTPTPLAAPAAARARHSGHRTRRQHHLANAMRAMVSHIQVAEAVQSDIRGLENAAAVPVPSVEAAVPEPASVVTAPVDTTI